MRALHQVVAGFTNGDAISNEARVLRDIFRGWGFESDIFCESRRILPRLRVEARDLTQLSGAVKPRDIVLLHLSIGSIANDRFRELDCRKALLYHNVTPPHFFDIVNPKTAAVLSLGRKQMADLSGVASVNLADSAYNATELAAAGYADVKVLPLVLDLNRLKDTPDPRTLTMLKDGCVNICFVGRCAPNKKLEDVIRTFYAFQEHLEPASRLGLVGAYTGMEMYQATLVTLAKELGVKNVLFPGAIPQAELNAYYAAADIFVCMSEHEGFCIPVIESMAMDVPVMAYAAGAVPETMDGAGILFREKHPEMVAEMMGRLLHDRSLRDAVMAGQRERMKRYMNRDLASELRGHLSPLLDEGDL